MGCYIYITTSGGFATLTNSIGYSTSVSVAHNAGSFYTINVPAHHSGSNYFPIAQAQATTSGNGGNVYYTTANIDGANPTTKCQVHFRADFAGSFQKGGNVFFYNVP